MHSHKHMLKSKHPLNAFKESEWSTWHQVLSYTASASQVMTPLTAGAKRNNVGQLTIILDTLPGQLCQPHFMVVFYTLLKVMLTWLHAVKEVFFTSVSGFLGT